MNKHYKTGDTKFNQIVAEIDQIVRGLDTLESNDHIVTGMSSEEIFKMIQEDSVLNEDDFRALYSNYKLTRQEANNTDVPVPQIVQA